MNAIYKSACLALCLTLVACGNKGDLYLEPIELTDAQKALLDDLDRAVESKKDSKNKKKAETSEPTK